MTYQEIKKQTEDRLTVIFEEYGVFFAFSDEQFLEGKQKYPVAEGEKYSSIGAGGYLPSKNVKCFLDAFEQMKEAERKALKGLRQEKEKAIRYELFNYECFYTGDISEVVELFKGIYTRTEIVKVFDKIRKTEEVY